MTKGVQQKSDDGADDVDLAAAAWHGRLTGEAASEPLRRAFEAWRAASPAHALAFAEVEAAWGDVREAAETPPMLALRHETLARLVAQPRPRRAEYAVLAGAAAVIAAVILGPLASRSFGPAATPAHPARPGASAPASRVYQTGVGDRLTINLADGSTAVLNTASRLRVAYSDKERRLTLEAGEALFEVAKGQPRPFVVAAGGHSITAHGTEFDVRLAPDQLKVALLEGEVSVHGHALAEEVRLKPNDVLTATGETTSVRAVSDISRLISWREGLVLFDNATLAQAADEMNRYVDRPRVEVEPSAANVRLSGAFRTDQAATFADVVQAGFPVTIVARSPERIRLGRARAPGGQETH